MKSFLKNKKGFTLIEVLVVVIIVAILAAIAVPIYMRYVESARSTEAKTALSALKTTYENRRQQYGTIENYTIEDAVKETQLSKGTKKSWEFEAVGNPLKKLIATSTSEYSAGEGKQVIYDIEEDEFTGYGIDSYTTDEEDEE